MRVLLAIAIAGLVTSVSNADEYTLSKPISRIRFDGTGTNMTVYFETPAGAWGSTGCANATYVMVRDVAGIKEILALGLAAKVAEKNVSFQGTCLNATYFSAYYIVVE